MCKRGFVSWALFLIVSFCSYLTSKAQLCNGSLGDPVVNITFGSTATNIPGIVPTGSYVYTANTCPDDGFYTITRSTTSCFGNTWHSVPTDHTGNGAFMLVNATFQPGDFFVTTVRGLCPNTTYEFASWIMNVINRQDAIQPNITFRIETLNGTILNQFNTGAIPALASPAWKQYGFFFTTTTGNSDYVLRMTNNAPGGIGNDLGLDDITFRPCGPELRSSISGSSNNESINFCANKQVPQLFTATLSPGFSQPVFQWQQSIDDGSSWNDIPLANATVYTRLPSSAGYFQYRLTVAESGNSSISSCRIASNPLLVTVNQLPRVDAGPDRTLIKGDQIRLFAVAEGSGLQFEWSPRDFLNEVNVLQPQVTAENDISYQLKVTDDNGCTAFDPVSVKVIDGLFIPSGFTPDGNLKNDVWRVRYLDPATSIVTIYNRVGKIVYQSNGDEVAWNGKYKGVAQPAGTYVYLIHFTNNSRMLKGTIILIR